MWRTAKPYPRTRIIDSARNRGSDARQDPPKLEASQNGAELALRKGIAGGFSPVVVALEVFEASRFGNSAPYGA